MKKQAFALWLSLSMLFLSSCALVVTSTDADQFYHVGSEMPPLTTPIDREPESTAGQNISPTPGCLLPEIQWTAAQLSLLRAMNWSNGMGIADKQTDIEVFEIDYIVNPNPDELPPELVASALSGWYVRINLQDSPGLLKDTALFDDASGSYVYAFFLLRLPCGGLKLDGHCGLGAGGKTVEVTQGTSGDRSMTSGETLLLVRAKILEEELHSRVTGIQLSIDRPDFLASETGEWGTD